MDSLTLNFHNSFENLNNKKTGNNFARRYLNFKLPQEYLKSNTSA